MGLGGGGQCGGVQFGTAGSQGSGALQLHLFSLHPVACLPAARNAGNEGNGGALSEDSNIHSWEVRLVQEFCDKGTLREGLHNGLFGCVGCWICVQV